MTLQRQRREVDTKSKRLTSNQENAKNCFISEFTIKNRIKIKMVFNIFLFNTDEVRSKEISYRNHTKAKNIIIGAGVLGIGVNRVTAQLYL